MIISYLHMLRKSRDRDPVTHRNFCSGPVLEPVLEFLKLVVGNLRLESSSQDATGQPHAL